jgi:hypothetical protein
LLATALLPCVVVACGSAGRVAPRAAPVISAAPQRPVLNEVPYDQPFAFVASSALFNGLSPQEPTSFDLAGVQRIRQTIAIPLASLGWYEVEPERARFRIALLHADGPSRAWRQRTDRYARSTGELCWERVWMGALHRGFVIERVSDGAIFSRLHRGGALDAGTADAFLGEELVKLILMRNPGPDAAFTDRPPAGARVCRGAPVPQGSPRPIQTSHVHSCSCI